MIEHSMDDESDFRYKFVKTSRRASLERASLDENILIRQFVKRIKFCYYYSVLRDAIWSLPLWF